MKKKIVILVALTFLLTACGEQTTVETSTSTVIDETEAQNIDKEIESLSNVTEVQTTESSTTLKDYLLNYPDSKTYHLLYDIALNEEANSITDEGVTYMFSKDDRGNRIIGNVIAYYPVIENLDTSSPDTFCTSFVDENFPELSGFMSNAETYFDEDPKGAVISFDDYSISLILDNDLGGMTVILSETE